MDNLFMATNAGLSVKGRVFHQARVGAGHIPWALPSVAGGAVNRAMSAAEKVLTQQQFFRFRYVGGPSATPGNPFHHWLIHYKAIQDSIGGMAVNAGCRRDRRGSGWRGWGPGCRNGSRGWRWDVGG